MILKEKRTFIKNILIFKNSIITDNDITIFFNLLNPKINL